MKVGIVIPVWGLSWMTVNCLKSIKANTDLSKIHIYIEEGETTRENYKTVNDYLNNAFTSFSHTLHSENLGFVGNTNSGIEKALKDNCTHVLMLNNDTITTPGWLDEMLLINSDITGIMSTPPDWRNLPQAQAIIANKTPYEQLAVSINQFAKGLEALKGEYRETDFVAFFCTLFKREVFEKIGLLDPDYTIGLFDDDDFNYRATKAGFKIAIAMGAYVHHYHNSTFIEHDLEYKKILDKNRAIFMSKHGFDPWDRIKNRQNERSSKEN